MLRIVFWQGILSLHQSTLIRHLALEQQQYTVILVVRKGMSEHRLKMGWFQPDFGNAKIIIQPDEIMIKQLIQEQPKHSVHIFSGFGNGEPLIKHTLQKIFKINTTIGFYVEARDYRGIKGKLRQLHSRYLAWYYTQDIDFVLAIGTNGMQCYQQAGFHKKGLYHFAYFTEFQDNLEQKKIIHIQKEVLTVRLLFIGSLIHLKGVDILLKALATLTTLDWNLDIIGNGIERMRLEIQTKSLGLSSHVFFRGTLGNIEVQSVLQESDILILPSRNDGWGAVINEALMHGVPVICTEACGAADLLTDSMRGEIVKTDSVEALQIALKKWILQGKLSRETHQKIQEWSKCISGFSAAQYLQKIISHVRRHAKTSHPYVPWL